MTREQSLQAIVGSMMRFQEEIADMLDAKATEAEKARNWITMYMLPHTFEDHGEQLKQALELHEQMIEVIDGLSKMQASLGQHLKLLLGQDEAMGGLGGMGGSGELGMFGGMGGK